MDSFALTDHDHSERTLRNIARAVGGIVGNQSDTKVKGRPGAGRGDQRNGDTGIIDDRRICKERNRVGLELRS